MNEINQQRITLQAKLVAQSTAQLLQEKLIAEAKKVDIAGFRKEVDNRLFELRLIGKTKREVFAAKAAREAERKSAGGVAKTLRDLALAQFDAKRALEATMDINPYPMLKKEIDEYKRLLDIGKISQEAFNAKVNDLLDIDNPFQELTVMVNTFTAALMDGHDVQDAFNKKLLEIAGVDDPFREYEEALRRIAIARENISGDPNAARLLARSEAELTAEYLDQREALAGLDALQERRLALTMREIDLGSSFIAMQERRGDLTSIEAANERDLIRLKRIKALEEARSQSGSPVQRAQLQQEINAIQAELGEMEQTLRDTFTRGFEGFFNDILDGTKSVEDSFKDMGNAILREINNIIAKDLGQQLARSLFGTTAQGAGGAEGLFGGILGDLAGTIFGGIGGFGGGSALSGRAASVGAYDFGAFANGGSFRVGGAGGIDSQTVRFKASPGETVTVTKPGESVGKGVNITNNFMIETPTGNVSSASQQQIAAQAGQSIRRALRRNG